MVKGDFNNLPKKTEQKEKKESEQAQQEQQYQEQQQEQQEPSLKEQRIRKIILLYYSKPDIRKAIYEFSKNRECVPRYFEGFGKRPDSFQFDSDIWELAKKGATSFHCSEELWRDPLELSTDMREEEIKKLRTGWDLLLDIDCKYPEYSKKAAKAIILAMNQAGINHAGIKFSVIGDTPVLVKSKKNISLLSIKEAIKLFKKTKNLSVLSLGKDHKIKFSKIYNYLEHEEEVYNIVHEQSKISLKATKHHSVFVFSDGRIIPKKVSDLAKNDFLITFNSLKNHFENKIKSTQNEFALGTNQFTKEVKSKKVALNKELMRLMGYYLAEGHINNTSYEIGFTFNIHEKEYIRDCTKLIEDLTNKKVSIRQPNTGSTQILIHSKEWYCFFENLCGKSKGKHLPAFSWGVSKELFLELLKGYIRGDGYKKGTYAVVIKSVALQLIRELIWLCKLQGISCSLYSEQNKPHYFPQGTLFKGSFVYMIKIPKSELRFEEFFRPRNKFSPLPRDKTFPISGLKKVYLQIKPKKFITHKVEQMTLKKERANAERIKKVITWFEQNNSQEFNEESKSIISDYKAIIKSDVGIVKIKSLKKSHLEKVYDLSVEETEAFFGNDYPVLLHNSGSKGFHIIIPWKAFPEEMSGKKTCEMFPEWPRLICQYLKEKSREFLEKDLYSSEDSSVLSKLKKGIRCEKCKNMSEQVELIHFICPSCKTKMENLTTAFERKRKIRCPNCQREMEISSRDTLYKCLNCNLDSRKNPENFNETFEHVDVFEVLGLDVILVSPRHLFRMPYSLHEKTALASVVVPFEKLDSFDMLRDADPFKISPIPFMPDCKPGEATQLLRNSLEFKPPKEEKEQTESFSSSEYEKQKNKKYQDFKLTNINPENYPPSIKKILEGMKTDGRKRALFILLSFFTSLKMSMDKIQNIIFEWDKKNAQPLKEGYIRAQLNWYSKQRETKLPPNFDKSYYKDIGITPTQDEINLKNPVSYMIKKSLGFVKTGKTENKFQNKPSYRKAKGF